MAEQGHTYTPAEAEAYWARTDFADSRHIFRELAVQKRVRVPVDPDVAAVYQRKGQPMEVRFREVNPVLPPDATTGRCCHCGEPATGHKRMYAVSMFEDTPHRIPVLHCDACRNSEACDREVTTPGSGMELFAMPGGYCELPTRELELRAEILPGARFLGPAIKWALAASGIYVLANLLIHSQAQQAAMIQGTANQGVCDQSSTSGRGYNAGDIRVLSGSAPASANAAESGSLGVDIPLPNPLFGAASGFPSTATANAISAATITGTITATYMRVVTNASTGVPTPEDGTLSTTQRRLQGTVATSAADFIVNTTSFVSGGSISVTSASYQAPN